MKLFSILIFTLLISFSSYSQATNGGQKNSTAADIIDYAINGIGINEYKNVLKKLGPRVIKAIEKSNSENKDVWLHAKVVSKDLKRQFILYLQEGSSCCQYFEISFNTSTSKKHAILSNYRDFISDNGIRLGIDSLQFKRRLNLPFIITQEGNRNVYTYLIYEEVDGKPIDQKKYIAQYIFENNRLIKFGFGNLYAIPNIDTH